jgi:hypothetical protein
MATKQAINQFVVHDRPFHEGAALRNVVDKAAAKVIEDNHFVTGSQQFFRYVRTDESGAAGDE